MRVHFLRLPLISLALLLSAVRSGAADLWSQPAFSASPAELRQAADLVKPARHSEATVLLFELRFQFEADGKLTETRHHIYRVENQQGVEGWAQVSGQWEAWHQAKPEIKARVITTDGAEHTIDPKTLSDFPVHEDAPDLYTDERKFGGPLPAIAPGAIVEEEVVIRDTAPLFAAGNVYRWGFEWQVPINKSRLVIVHPDSLSLRYQTHQLAENAVQKSHDNGVETITVETGPSAARTEDPSHVPADVILGPEIEFSTAATWTQVAAEYLRMTADKLRSADAQALLARIDLKNGARSEIIRRLVASLHKNVRYTGIEFGESSLVPQFPSETLKRKYGDCKDKAALLVTMLQAAGIPAHLALLTAGPGRDVNPDLPGVGMFDHAIVYVPASGSDPDLWIDATAQYSQVGTLPWMDYGRLALIIAPDTTALKKIPDLTAQQNVHQELRVFHLAEFGDASIIETDDEIGPEQADYREYYLGDTKELRKNCEDYVKEAYLADSLTALEHGDLSDLDKPSSIKFITKGRRGTTELDRAVVAIRVEDLFDRLPKYFKTEEKDKQADASDTAAARADADSDTPKPRTVDWQIAPFVTEWQYEITAPVGFKLRALPSDKHENISVLTFSQQYSANPEGTVVKAVLRVECTSTRLTAQQGKDLRDAVLKARNSDPILVTFDQTGHSLIAAGKIKDGLAAYRQLVSLHPKEALHKVQLAQALLTAGLGEEARVVAREATTLEPSSAQAFSTLGMVLKHDQIGRPMKKGIDYDGAVAAYRKAIALDPKDKDNRANLAILLEYDSSGIRYSDGAHLKDAVAEFRALKQIDEEYTRPYDDNILYDLWYAHDYQGVLDYAATLPASDVRKGFTVGAIAVIQGADAALKKSLEITTTEENRSQILVSAGSLLMRVRQYKETSAIFTEAAKGQSNGGQLARSASMLANTHPFEELKLDPNDPRSVLQQLFGMMISGKLTLADGKSMFYSDPQYPDPDLDEQAFQQMMSILRGQLRATGLPLGVIADLTVSNMHYTVDGDDSLGYKIIAEGAGAAPQEIYVIHDGGRYKIVGFSTSDNTDPEELAPAALRELDRKNLPAARKWLDRARDRIHMGGGDDPLAGNPFPYFWTKGQEGDASAVRIAALVLLPSSQLKGENLTAVTAARDAAKTDLDRARLNMVLAYAYSAQEKWEAMLPLTLDVLKAFPASLRAFDLAVTAYTGSKRYDDWDKLVHDRLTQHPDELAYTRSAARLAASRGQFAKSREIIKTISDKGQATGGDLNLYAWYALELPGQVEQETVDLAIRANDLSKDSFALEHTLGCVYAQAGKTNEARELLLKAMDSNHLEEPNSEIWFGFGLIAEQYGIVDAAEKMYARVEKPKVDYPASSYQLAQQHLSALHDSARNAVKSSGE